MNRIKNTIAVAKKLKLSSIMTKSELPSIFNGTVDLGIIGGTGLYNLDCLEPIALLPPMVTPWGITSSPVTISQFVGTNSHFHVAFIARHGVNHRVSSH